MCMCLCVCVYTGREFSLVFIRGEQIVEPLVPRLVEEPLDVRPGQPTQRLRTFARWMAS